MKFHGVLGAVFLLISVLLLGACGGGGGGSSSSGSTNSPSLSVTTEEAQQQAIDAVSRGLIGGVERFTDLTAESAAGGGSSTMMSTSPLRVLRSMDAQGSLNDQVEQFLTQLISNPSRDAGTITYKPDPVLTCQQSVFDQVFAPDLAEQAQCEALVSRIELVQTITSDTSGTVAYRFDGSEPLVLGYTSISAYIEVDLAQLKSAVESIMMVVNPSAPTELPVTFNGVIRVTETELGANAASITVGVTEGINIDGMFDGQQATFTLAPTDKLLEIIADADAQTGSVELSVGAISALFPVQDDASMTVLAGELSLAALTGRFDLDNNTQTLSVTNFGIGDQPFTVKVDGQEAVRLALDTLSMTLNGNEANFETGLSINLFANNISGILDDFLDMTTMPVMGTLALAAPAGTVFLDVQDPTNPMMDITQVMSGGPLTVMGTDSFEGSLTAMAGTCFTETQPAMMMTGFLFEAVTCP